MFSHTDTGLQSAT